MVTAKRLIEGSQLTAGAVTYYTAPATPFKVTTRITKLTLTNTTGTAQTATVYLIPNGGAAGAASMITSVKPIGPNQSVDVLEVEGHVLMTGDFIQAFASAVTSITIMASGIEMA